VIPQPHARAREIGRDAEQASVRIAVRTMLTAIGLVLATLALVLIVARVERVLVWIVIAVFFAVALNPVVNVVQRRLLGGRRRSVATLLVFLAVVLVLIGIAALFAVPLSRQAVRFGSQLPDLIAQARAGHGVVGHLLERTHALQFVQQHQDQLQSAASGLTSPAVGVLRGVATGVAAAVTIFVLAYLMVLEAPKIVSGCLALLPAPRAERVRRVASDCARSVTGYIAGNLAISVICGVLTFAVLEIMRVPFAGLLALFVAIADLIPLVGATIGAVVAVVAAFVHSVPAGIVAIVFFVVYQQVENHLLQPVIFARTVKLNPLTVLVAILIAVELAGVLGALLAIPVAGIIQVIVRDLWDHRRGTPKTEPTVGEDREPADRDPDPGDARPEVTAGAGATAR
jgi:predicted PurR-regulated permease PerM